MGGTEKNFICDKAKYFRWLYKFDFIEIFLHLVVISVKHIYYEKKKILF